MKNKELYDKTVGILVDAYFNDTLEHRSCSACAVGNIVAANMGISFDNKNQWEDIVPMWDEVFVTSEGENETTPSEYKGDAKTQIDSTGYTWPQLALIEYAFESASKCDEDEFYNEDGQEIDEMFNGLCEVIDALDIIHENTDTVVTMQSKQKFNKNSMA